MRPGKQDLTDVMTKTLTVRVQNTSNLSYVQHNKNAAYKSTDCTHYKTFNSQTQAIAICRVIGKKQANQLTTNCSFQSPEHRTFNESSHFGSDSRGIHLTHL
jgi:hypothetical protein